MAKAKKRVATRKKAWKRAKQVSCAEEGRKARGAEKAATENRGKNDAKKRRRKRQDEACR